MEQHPDIDTPKTLKHSQEVDITPSAITIPKINKSDSDLDLQDEGWYNSAQEEDLKQYSQ